MLYRVQKLEDIFEYEGKGHFTCKATRLHTCTDMEGGQLTMGITHFFPHGGAFVRETQFEMIYYALKGGITIITADTEDGEQTRHYLKEGESIRFMPGACRGIDNDTEETVQMMVVMIVPQK